MELEGWAGGERFICKTAWRGPVESNDVGDGAWVGKGFHEPGGWRYILRASCAAVRDLDFVLKAEFSRLYLRYSEVYKSIGERPLEGAPCSNSPENC